MRDYGKISPRFWTGDTGKRIRKKGRDAQVAALYLLTCPLSNMIGLYYLPLPTLAHETGMSLQGASKALQSLSEAEFAYYEGDNEVVFVPEMASQQIGEPLKKQDKRVKGVIKEWQAMRKSRFYAQFHARYADSYHLPNMSSLPPTSKPLASQEQEQEQKQEQEQEQEIKSAHINGHFQKPSLDQVVEYCRERGKGVDPQKWFDYYTANGWRVGRTQMKDWQASVRTWERNNFNNQDKGNASQRVGPGQRFRPEANQL